MKFIYEYIWIDAIGEYRSKTMISKNFYTCEWNFDGSSTGQASGSKSDVVLKPVRIFKDPFRQEKEKNENVKCFLVLCETLNMDGTPHETNTRRKYIEICGKTSSEDPLFGMEQEYIFYGKDGFPYGWNGNNSPNSKFEKQNYDLDNNMLNAPFYCSNGTDKAFGRNIVEKHMSYCLYADISICGINSEVMASQWEFQIGICKAEDIGDELIMARYILIRVAEEFGAIVDFSVKPMEEWNGSGCHTNFSTKKMRGDGGYYEITLACEKLSLKHYEHLLEYGDETNKLRLTGKHETSSYDKFTYGNSDRSCSVRIPYKTHSEGKGYFEDRRPASNCDPYKVVGRILQTICINEDEN